MIDIRFTDDAAVPCREELGDVTRAELEMLCGYHALPRIDVTYDTFSVENLHVKVSAAADEPGVVTICVNTFAIDWADLLRNIIPRTLAHEFHHMVRWLYVDEFHLAELAVTEGLADHFLLEVKGGERPRYLRHIDDDLLTRLRPAILRDLYDTSFNMRLWQRGDETQGIPSAFGYSLGFKLVGDFLAAHGQKASQCFDLDCRAVFALLT